MQRCAAWFDWRAVDGAPALSTTPDDVASAGTGLEPRPDQATIRAASSPISAEPTTTRQSAVDDASRLSAKTARWPALGRASRRRASRQTCDLSVPLSPALPLSPATGLTTRPGAGPAPLRPADRSSTPPPILMRRPHDASPVDWPPVTGTTDTPSAWRLCWHRGAVTRQSVLFRRSRIMVEEERDVLADGEPVVSRRCCDSWYRRTHVIRGKP